MSGDRYGKKQTELETEMKISNAADNVDMSQERDTRCRRVQEVNRLCVIKYVNRCVACGVGGLR